MRVLLYNDTYSHVGGAETYCLELDAKLPEHGHEVFWLAHGEQEPMKENHIVLPHYNEGKLNYFYSKYFFNKAAYKAIKEVILSVRPDVVHLHHDRFYTFSMMKALKDTGIPVVKTVHDYTMLCPSQYYPDLYYDTPGTKSRKDGCELICSQGSCLPFKQRIGHPFAHDRKRKRIQHRYSTFIAPSVKLKEYLEKAGFEGVEFVPFFVDEKKWSFDEKRDVKNKVLFVGRVERNKGIYHLIDAIKDLRSEIPDISLTVAGAGGEYEPILKMVEQEKLDYIQPTGFVDYSKINEYYESSNLLVVPSLDMEQFGLIGIEGLASGIAVIGSNMGGIPEWCIDGETGLLFDAERPEELKGRIKMMLQDDALRLELTRKGMSHIRSVYNEEQHFRKLDNLFEAAAPIRGFVS